MSNWKPILLATPLLMLALTPGLQAKDHWRKHSGKEWKHRAERNHRSVDPRYDNYRYYNRNSNGYNYRNVPRGLDRNGNGVVDRYEWRGNQRSWEQRNRNRYNYYDRNTVPYRYYRR
jgi:hypothetical protein